MKVKSAFSIVFIMALALLLSSISIQEPVSAADPAFVDVPLDHPYHNYIEALYANGYVAGCSEEPRMYCPEGIMNRAESAVFVDRGNHGAEYDPPDPVEVVFADVGLDAWYADWVHGLWDDGYTAGCGTDPLVYCPDEEHTRAEGCVFYLRMMYGADYEPPLGKGYFEDVDAEAWYADWVDAAWEAGIAEPCSTEPLRYCPEEGLTRAVAAYMMVQAKDLPLPTPTATATPTSTLTPMPTATTTPTSPPVGEAIIVDHTSTDLSQIPDEWLERAKELAVHYGHTSHGSQILAGLNYLETYVDPVKYSVAIGDRTGDRTPRLPAQENSPALRVWEEGLWPDTTSSHLGYWEGEEAQQGTMSVLDTGLFDVSGWSWCGQVSQSEWPYIQEYLDVMVSFEQQQPDVTFFYMTGHNVAPGPPNHQQVAYERTHSNNDGIKEFVIENDRVLFDFADIEAWDPAGNYYPEEDGTCVWCESWCNQHPEDCANIPERCEVGSETCCAHTHGLHCVLKAKAFWWMMARLAGWDGTPANGQ
jgi:hypothetical protein